jgi:hypothetical protein
VVKQEKNIIKNQKNILANKLLANKLP